MASNSFVYSLKVWLSSVFLAPVFYIIATSFKENHQDFASLISDRFFSYLMCVILGGIFSSVTWILFLLVIKTTTIYTSSISQVKLIISIVGILLTIATFAVFLGPSIIDIHDEFFYLMLGNCICIGGGSWFYKLRIDDTSVVSEIH